MELGQTISFSCALPNSSTWMVYGMVYSSHHCHHALQKAPRTFNVSKQQMRETYDGDFGKGSCCFAVVPARVAAKQSQEDDTHGAFH
jgi:hypothetical protein